MKIGLDLDGVVLDTEKQFRNEAELYDILKLNRNSTKDQSAQWAQDRYKWADDEKNEFIEKYLIEGTKKSHIMPGAKEVIELLKFFRIAHINMMIDNSKLKDYLTIIVNDIPKQRDVNADNFAKEINSLSLTQV